jgi:hypothetical protein
MKKIKFLTLIVFCVLLAGYAQQNHYWTVTDTNGQPLPEQA